MTGTVTRLLLTRGYGFVRGSDGRDYFLHASALPPGIEWDGARIRVGLKIDFTPDEGGKGGNRLRALDAVIMKEVGQ